MSMIGKLRVRVILQQELRTPDYGGGVSIAWGNVATVWTQVEPLSGRENFGGNRLFAMGSFRMRFRAGVAVTPTMRVLWGERVFNIRSVRNLDERNRLIELIVEEGVGT